MSKRKSINHLEEKGISSYRNESCHFKTIAATFLARIGKNKEEIKKYIEDNYYSLDFMLDDIREHYEFDVTCQGSVPQAIKCFLEAADFEDAIRNAVSLGGDCDTQAAMAGAIAEPFFGIPEKIRNKVFDYMDDNIKGYCDKYVFLVIGGEQDE